MKCYQLYKLAMLLFALLIMVIGCSETEDEGTTDDGLTGPGNVTYTDVDLEGMWLGIMPDTASNDVVYDVVIGLGINNQGKPTQMMSYDNAYNCSGDLNVSGTGQITGNMQVVSGGQLQDTVTYEITGQFVSKNEITMNGTVTSTNVNEWDDYIFAITLKKEGFQYINATLNRWVDTDETWWINITVYTQGALRVYVTGTNIEGEYDLYKCGDFGFVQYWWSSNNPNCDVGGEGGNNYSFHYVPQLPFNIEIHVVTAAADIKHLVTINDFLFVTDND